MNSPLGPRDRRPSPLTFVKFAVFALVLWGIWRSLTSIRSELDAQQLDPRTFHWDWFAWAAAWYAVAQVPTSMFWRRILNSFGLEVSRWTAFRAFNLGNPGKYVPTKMLVVAIRAGVVAGMSAALPQAIASVFVETFTTMAAGAGLATLALTCFATDVRVWILSLASLAFCFAGSLPASLRFVARLVMGKRWNLSIANAMNGLDMNLMMRGWGYALLTWLAMSASVMATLRVLPDPPVVDWTLSAYARILAGTCLAVVAGFVSLIPGGLFAREWVLGLILAPMIGTTAAVAVPVLLRVNWLLTEAIGAGILVLIGAGRKPTDQQSPLVRP